MMMTFSSPFSHSAAFASSVNSPIFAATRSQSL
jgi:hypothetical protein